MLEKDWTFGFMVVGYFYSTQKGMGDSVGTYSYRTAGREKVISATGFMAQTGSPEQCALRAGGQAAFALQELFAICASTGSACVR